MREDELEKNLQPFLAYLAQTPVNELLNDYTYQLVFIGHDGQIAAVRAGDQIYLAHVWLDKSGVLQLLPSNVAYSSHFFAGDALNAVQIIGKAVEVWHILNPAGSPESPLPQNDPQGVPV